MILLQSTYNHYIDGGLADILTAYRPSAGRTQAANLLMVSVHLQEIIVATKTQQIEGGSPDQGYTST